jgi:hypothetical protein
MEKRTLAHERVLVALDSGEDRVVDAGLAHVVGQQVVCTLRLLRRRAAGVAGAQFTCFYWYKSTDTDRDALCGCCRRGSCACCCACAAAYLLYWYKSTNTDRAAPAALARALARAQQFTCVTGTKVQILTELHLRLLRVLLRVRRSLLALLVQKYKY